MQQFRKLLVDGRGIHHNTHVFGTKWIERCGSPKLGFLGDKIIKNDTSWTKNTIWNATARVRENRTNMTIYLQTTANQEQLDPGGHGCAGSARLNWLHKQLKTMWYLVCSRIGPFTPLGYCCYVMILGSRISLPRASQTPKSNRQLHIIDRRSTL